VITREIPTELHVRGSSGRLAQLFTNLIINAVQAMPDRPAGGNLVRVTAAVVGDEVTIAVADNGSGIAPEVRDRLFMPFATTKPIGVGTGLGLSVCRQIVDALGGTIEVEDGDGDGGPGTTFQIRLPRARGNREPSQPLPAVSAPITARRVLIIDDEPLVRSVTARILRHHEIHTVASVTEALDLLARDPAFDAIICDLMMPGRTGMDFHAALAAIAPALLDRCVFATGGAVTTAARAFVDQLAPDRLLDKPYDLGALDAAIRAVAR
jgi:CheY-like chemotaxis protein